MIEPTNPPNSSEFPNTSPDPELPPDVAALLDEASEPNGLYSAKPHARSIDLVETATGRIIRTVQWDGAGEWSRKVLAALSEQTQGFSNR